MVKRYNPVRVGEGCMMVTCGLTGEGKWVRAEKYDKLKRQYDDLVDRVANSVAVSHRDRVVDPPNPLGTASG